VMVCTARTRMRREEEFLCRHCEERPAYARSASYGGFESTEARSAKVEATKQSRTGTAQLDCFAALAMTASFLLPASGRGKGKRGTEKESAVRRKVSAADWKYPRRMTYSEWRRLPYLDRYWFVAQAQCTLLGYWRDCPKPFCRRLQQCKFPHPCYWDRKRQMSDEEKKQMDKVCAPPRALLKIGSSKRSQGLWLF
jgi:hypothetical protein